MYIKSKRFISKFLLLIMLISYLIPTINSVSYALDNKEEIENVVEVVDQNDVIDDEKKIEKDENSEFKNENVEEKEIELKDEKENEIVNEPNKEAEDLEMPEEPEETNKEVNLYLNYGENDSNNKGINKHPQLPIDEETLQDIINTSYGLGNKDLSKEKIGDDIYTLQEIIFTLDNGEEINLNTETINESPKNNPKLITNQIIKESMTPEGTKAYVFDFDHLDRIDLNYKVSKSLRTVKIKFEEKDPYHLIDNKELDIRVINDFNINYYIDPELGNKSKLEVTYTVDKTDAFIKEIEAKIVDSIAEDEPKSIINVNNKNYNLETLESSNGNTKSKIVFDLYDSNLQEDINEIKLDAKYKPSIMDDYGKIEFKNKYNKHSETYKFKLIEDKLSLIKEGEKEAAIAIDKLVEYKFKNRSENSQNKLDEDKIYFNDLVEYIYKNKDEEINGQTDETIKLNYNNLLVKNILNRDVNGKKFNYEYDGNKNGELLLEAKSKDSIEEINFDYAKKHIQINHIGDDKRKISLDLEVMPDTKYLYIKPQAEGKLEGYDEVTIDGEVYKKIELDLENLDNVQKINIIYDGVAPLIESKEYQTGDMLIRNDGTVFILNGIRTFTVYKGSIFTTQPIYAHNTSIKSNIAFNKYNLADYKYKVVRVDDSVDILGYFQKEDLDLKNNDYIPNLFEEKTTGTKNKVEFDFINENYTIYREIHRTAFNGNQDGDEYDLELTGEGIKKHNILETKYYIVPKGKIINLSPVDLGKDEYEGYELITSDKVNGKINENMIIMEKDDQVYLAGPLDYTLKNNRYDFIYTYKSVYKVPTKIEPVKINLEFHLEQGDGIEVNTKKFVLEYPRFKGKDGYEALIPINELVTCYSLYDVEYELNSDDIDENVILYDIDLKEVTKDDIGKVKFLGIKIKDKDLEDEYKDFFPKTKTSRGLLSNIKTMVSLKNDESTSIEGENTGQEEQIKNKIVLKYNNKKESCVPEEIKIESVDINIRYEFKNKETGEDYTTDEGYKITALRGSMARLTELRYDPIIESEGSLSLEYIPYGKDLNNTGVTDKDGKHIQINEYDKSGRIINKEKIDTELNSYIKIGNSDTNNPEPKEYYLNYKVVEKNLPKEDEQIKEYRYKKELYYIPFSYFEEIKTSGPLIDEIIELDESIIGCENTKLILPRKTDSYKEKLDKIEKLINNFYSDNLNKLKLFYETKKYESLFLEDYINANSSDSIEEYSLYLTNLLSEIESEENNLEDLDKKEEEVINIEELKKEIDLISILKSQDLIKYLEDNDVPVVSKETAELSEYTQKIEEISWEEPFVKGNNFTNSINKYFTKRTNEDSINNKRTIHTVNKSTRYSQFPISIGEHIIDQEKTLKFLENPASEINENLGSVEIEGLENKETIIPVIYLERENLCKNVTIENINTPDPEEKDTSIKINHYRVKKVEDKNGEINYEVEKDSDGNDKAFYTFKYNKLPYYLIGKNYPWKILSFKNYNYIPETYINLDYNESKNNKEGDIKFSKKIIKNENNELNVYYEGEGDIVIDESKVNVIGYLKQDNGENKEIYRYSITGIVGTDVEIYPYNLENESKYLLDTDGNIIDKYDGVSIKLPTVKDDVATYRYYYKEITDPQEKPKRVEIFYVNEDGINISEEDLFVLRIPEESTQEIFKAKSISGYKERIKEYKFNLLPNKELEILEKDGMEIVTSDDKLFTVQNKVTKEKVLEFKDDEEKALIKFYYDKIVEPKPTPNPDPKPPVDPGKPGVENKIKFTYDANGGLVDEKENIKILLDRGTKIKNNKVAYKDGYIFKGWSKVKDEEELFDFTKPINKNTTVYALWEKDKDKLDKVNHFEYIKGYPDESVRPENNITREEVSAVFYRLLTEDYKQNIYSLDNNFKDLSRKRWSNKHISTLANGNILTGYEDGEFKYNKFITRAEVATIASRFENLDESDHNFTDVKGHWAEEYIASASKKGWVEGYKDESFRPDEYITRAEFVTLVNRVLNRGVKKENILEGIKEFKDLKDNTWYYEEFVEAINGHTFDRDNEKDRTSEKWLQLWTYVNIVDTFSRTIFMQPS